MLSVARAANSKDFSRVTPTVLGVVLTSLVVIDLTKIERNFVDESDILQNSRHILLSDDAFSIAQVKFAEQMSPSHLSLQRYSKIVFKFCTVLCKI